MKLLRPFIFFILIISAMPGYLRAQESKNSSGQTGKSALPDLKNGVKTDLRNPKSDLVLLLKMKAIAKDNKDELAEARLNLKIANRCRTEGILKEGLKYMQNGIFKMRELGQLDTLPVLYQEYSKFNDDLGFENNAIDACKSGLSILTQIRDLNINTCEPGSNETPENEKLRKWFLDRLVTYSDSKGDFGNALIHNNELLEILKKSDSLSSSYASVLMNTGTCYLKKRDKDAVQAEKQFKKAIRIFESLHDRNYLSTLTKCRILLAQARIEQRNFDTAGKDLNSALSICRENNFIPLESEIYCHKAAILLYNKNLQEALRASSYALSLAKKVGKREKTQYLKQALESHAQILSKMGEYREANETLIQLKRLISEELNEEKENAKRQKLNLEKSSELEKQFEQIAELEASISQNAIERKQAETEIKLTRLREDSLMTKRSLDSTKFKAEIDKRRLEFIALESQKERDELKNYRDSISNQRKIDSLNTQNEKAQKKSEELELSRSLEEKKRKEADDKKQLYLLGSVILLLLTSTSAYFAWDSMRKNRRLKEGQLQIEQANNALGSLNRQLTGKNKSITESIQYARGIQAAILPAENRWKEAFPDSFVYYVPKDIVSGDFYYLSSEEDRHILAFADCTGHGVPGALMSIIGHNLLTSATEIHGLNNPADILSFMDQGLRTTLQQEGHEGQDGMEVGICIFNLKNNQLVFAGSRRPLYGMKDGEFFEWKGDRHYLGAGKTVFRDFTNYACSMENLTEIWLSSDGYPDQFGGPELKRFHSGKLKQLLASLAGQNAESQKEVLAKTFTDWKINTAQLDDVMLIGIRPETMRKS